MPPVDRRRQRHLEYTPASRQVVIEVEEKLDERLLEILACPACKGDVRQKGDTIVCVGECGRIYPIREGIPIMLIEEATLPQQLPGRQE